MMDWIKIQWEKFKIWLENQKELAIIKRKAQLEKLDKAIALEKEKANIRTKQQELQRLRMKGRPAPRSTLPAQTLKSTDSFSLKPSEDFFKGFK